MIPMLRLQALAGLAGADDPRVRSIMRTAALFPETRETAEQLLSAMCLASGVDVEATPAFDWPREVPAEGRHLGNVLAGSARQSPFHYPLGGLPGNLALYGASGTGKSTLVRHLCEWLIGEGLTVVVFDVADEYGSLLRLFGANILSVVSARTFPLAIFANPPGSCLGAVARVGQVVGCLRESAFLRDGSCNLLTKVVGDLYEERGVFGGSRSYPTASEVLARLTDSKFRPGSRHAGYLETLVNRLQGLVQSFPGMNARRSPGPRDALGRSLIVRMADLSPAEIDSFGSQFLAWMMCGLQGEIRDRTVVVLVLEEVHLQASRQKVMRADLGEPLVVRLVRTGRKHGLASVLVDQVPSELPAGLLGNVATRIVLRLTNSPCVDAVARSMGLQRDQAGELAELPRRRAVVQTPDLPQPFLIEVVEIPRAEQPAGGELAERERESLELLDFDMADRGATCTPSDGPTAGAPAADANRADPVRGDLRKVLERVCSAPYEFIEERCAATGLDRSREHRARRHLEKLGLIQLAEKLGAKWQLYVPTAEGSAWAEREGVSVHRAKGSVAHERMVRDVQQRLTAFSDRVEVIGVGESVAGTGVQPDLLVRVRDAHGDASRVVAFQMCWKNKAASEVEAARALLAARQISLVVMVARNKGGRDGLERALRAAAGGDGGGRGGGDGAGEAGSRLRVVDFESVVGADYDWGWVVGDG
jgi:hypothetical protein